MANDNENNEGRLDLVLTRDVAVPPALMWKAWTQPEHVKKWFTPAPWTTPDCEIDLCPGGMFRTVMRSPEGQENTVSGCYLEVVPFKKLVWTDALVAGYRPAVDQFLMFTAILTFEEHAGGTRYTARVLHKDDADRQRHADMGFEAGWGKALDQLIGIADQLKD